MLGVSKGYVKARNYIKNCGLYKKPLKEVQMTRISLDVLTYLKQKMLDSDEFVLVGEDNIEPRKKVKRKR